MEDERLLAYLESFLTERRVGLFKKVLARRTKHFTVATEDVYQLHNTSAVMRSCDVFGVQEINVIEERKGKRIDREIAMGAQKWVDVNRYHTTNECITSLRSQGYQIIATSPHNESCMLDEFDITKKSALFFGTEREGLSEEVLAQADGFLKIPMEGFTESLNISVSAAIILQHLTTRLRQSEIDWQLTPQEIFEKRMDWSKKSIRSLEDVMKRYEELNA